MKVIVLNYSGTYVEVSDVPMSIATELDEGKICDAEAMMMMGYDIQDTHWMFSDEDIPVFWKDEVVPYTSL